MFIDKNKLVSEKYTQIIKIARIESNIVTSAEITKLLN